MTFPPSYEDIIELALPDGALLPSEDTDVYTSKLGGRPVWLNHPSKDLLDSLKCPLCGTDLYHLLQMDCPREEYPSVDRIVYVFVCNTRACSQDARGWKVVFMMKHKDDEQEQESMTVTAGKTSFWDSLMNEQVEDKKNPLTGTTSAAKSEPKSSAPVPLSNPKNKFPGIYLHIDEEIIVEKREKKSVIPENITIASEATAGGDEEWSGEQYEKFRAPGTDKSFNRFQKRVAHYPRQCVRYAVSGAQTPLLYHDLNINSAVAKLGACEHCDHAVHRFELQLMPAVLAFLPTESAEYLKHIPEVKKSSNPMVSDGMEWGSVMVYSCGAFCGLDKKTEVAEGKVIIQLELQ